MEEKHKSEFTYKFFHTIQSLRVVAATYLDNQGNPYEISDVVRQLSIDCGVAYHPQINTVEFASHGTAEKCRCIYRAFLEVYVVRFEQTMAMSGRPMDQEPVTRREEMQLLQQSLWPAFCNVVACLERKIREGEVF